MDNKQADEHPFTVFLKLLEEASDPPPPTPEWEMQDQEWRVLYDNNQWIMQDKFNDQIFVTELEEYEHTGTGFAKAMAKASKFRTGRDILPIKENIELAKQSQEISIYPNNMIWMLYVPCLNCQGYSLPLPITVGSHNLLAQAIGNFEYSKIDNNCMQCRGKELRKNDLDDETYAISWFDPEHKDWMLKVKLDINKSESVIFSLGVGQLATESDIKHAISTIINI